MIRTRLLGVLFGGLAGLFEVVSAIITAVLGIAFLVVGHTPAGVLAGSRALVTGILGVLTWVFMVLAATGGRDQSLAGGAVLLVLSIVEVTILAFADHLLTLLAFLFTIIAAVLFMIQRY